MDFCYKESYNINDLIQIVEILRAPDGCPWDKEQNHQSIKKNFIEETYEVIEAINKSDTALLKEELGDVLLQIVFHSQMESEQGSFDFNGVCSDICKKLIIRHPHIFSDVKVASVDDVLKNWDDIKKTTKAQKTQSDAMESIPRELPALMRAEKVQQKAAKVGFDWQNIDGAFDKLTEEIGELKVAILENDANQINDELGDLLFSAVNVARFCKADAEESLTYSTDKFIRRFTLVEKLSHDSGDVMSECSLEQLDELWEKAKNIIKSGL